MNVRASSSSSCSPRRRGGSAKRAAARTELRRSTGATRVAVLEPQRHARARRPRAAHQRRTVDARVRRACGRRASSTGRPSLTACPRSSPAPARGGRPRRARRSGPATRTAPRRRSPAGTPRVAPARSTVKATSATSAAVDPRAGDDRDGRRDRIGDPLVGRGRRIDAAVHVDVAHLEAVRPVRDGELERPRAGEPFAAVEPALRAHDLVVPVVPSVSGPAAGTRRRQSRDAGLRRPGVDGATPRARASRRACRRPRRPSRAARCSSLSAERSSASEPLTRDRVVSSSRHSKRAPGSVARLNVNVAVAASACRGGGPSGDRIVSGSRSPPRASTPSTSARSLQSGPIASPRVAELYRPARCVRRRRRRRAPDHASVPPLRAGRTVMILPSQRVPRRRRPTRHSAVCSLS